MMQDRKALQAGTSHFLGQNFAKAAGIKYLSEEGREEFAWTTSWGVSTRLVGGLVMTHSDDDGLILPPRLAPAHVVILPVLHKEESRAQVLEYCESLKAELRAVQYDGRPVEVELDTRDLRGGEKVWSWIKKGVPIRLEVGPRDVEADAVFAARRDRAHKDKKSIPRAEFIATVANTLTEMQDALFARAKQQRTDNTVTLDDKDEFYNFFTPQNTEKPEIHGGYAMCHWNGSSDVEAKIKDDLNVTIRCVPLDAEQETGTCIISGEPSSQRVVFAKSY
jgi:prolyl-tRNA synthetase